MYDAEAAKTDPGVLTLIYDGECPFCSRFVELYRIRRNVGRVNLVDAREHPDAVRDVRSRGLDIDEGMVGIWQGRFYYGQEAVSLMAMLGAEGGLFARANRLLFLNPKVAATIYPWMVRGRRTVLKMMGRKLIA